MANQILDKAYKVEPETGLISNVVVVCGIYSGGCRYPDGANSPRVLGVTTGSGFPNRYVSVRKSGIASIVAAEGIFRGDAVCVADDQGRIKSAAKASGTTGVIGNNNSIKWTAKNPGSGGNNIIIDIVVSGNSTALSVAVTGNTITINSATSEAGAALTTALEAIAAVEEDDAASLLVVGANNGASAGSGAIADQTLHLSGGESGDNIIGYAEESASEEGDIIDVFLTL